MKHIVFKICLGAILLCMVSTLWADIIVTTDARRIEAKVTEVYKTEIRYKDLDNLDGPVYVLPIEDIISVVYSNGKVVLYNQASKPVEEKIEVKQGGRLNTAPYERAERTYESTKSVIEKCLTVHQQVELDKYLDGFPKKLVLIKGNSWMLYSKSCRVFFDIKYDDAELVEYGHNDKEYRTLGGTFNERHVDNYLYFQKYDIIRAICTAYNQKLRSNKCTLRPEAELVSSGQISKNAFLMTLYIDKLDLGSSTVSNLSAKQTDAGGAIIVGRLEVLNLATNTIDAVLLVDRVKGLGSNFNYLRFHNAIEEAITNQLFFVKDFRSSYNDRF